MLVSGAALLGFTPPASNTVTTVGVNQAPKPETFNLGDAPSRLHLRAGETYTWFVNLHGKKPQTLLVQVRNRFPIGSLWKVFTPFAAATAINRATQPATGAASGESPTVQRALPLNLTAGVVATVGTVVKSQRRRQSLLTLTYYNQAGQAVKTDTRWVRHGKAIDVALRSRRKYAEKYTEG